MGELRCVRYAWFAAAMIVVLCLPACGGHKPPGTSPFPAKITLIPSISASMQVGSTMSFSASAQNSTNTSISPTFTYSSDNTSIVDVSPTGIACAGTWNAPFYNVCTPGKPGTANVTATALNSTSAPTLVFVHPPIDNIQVSVVPPVNPPPPACPSQTELPPACQVPFNAKAAAYCVSQNQVQTLQASAYSKGVDVTPYVGPFTWSQANLNVVKLTPIVSGSSNVPTNQVQVTSSTPGATQLVASASGVSSQPYLAETCPVQCITLQLGNNGSQNIDDVTFSTNKGTSQTVNVTAVDVQGCAVPTPPLTWTSSAPAAITAGSATAGCSASATCAIAATQPGAATITATCTPPTCNVGFPLNAPGLPSLYLPQPVYPVSAISGLVTGATSATSVLASSQDCYSNAQCTVALYDISTTTNLASSPSALPTPPNSLIFDAAGDKAYAGSQFGAVLVTTANLGSSSTNPFTSLPAPQTPLGLVTGRVLAVSPNGSLAVFSDTISNPNQVYVVNTNSSASTTAALSISGATAAAFTPDSSKAFILGNGGNTLYVYSPLQALQTLPALTAPANAIAFSSNGGFAFVAGGSSTASLPVLNTCNNSPAVEPPPPAGTGTVFSITGLPAAPLFLKMVPPGSAPTGNASIPALYLNPNPAAPNALDVFVGVDNTGVDVFATSITTPITGVTTLCPSQQITLATEAISPLTPVPPTHISLNKGPFHPLNFFLSPDGNQVYIITSDQGVLVYNFTTQTTNAIPLNGNAAPVAADITVDGTLLYVAGSDGTLHVLDTLTLFDVTDIQFFQLPNSSNNFCYSSYTCSLNIVAIKP